MLSTTLLEQALHIITPWHIRASTFSKEDRRLDIHIDFERGAKFFYEDVSLGVKGEFPVYDTVEKSWRHLNFFEHECYLLSPRCRE